MYDKSVKILDILGVNWPQLDIYVLFSFLMDLVLRYLVYKMNIQNFVAHLISWHDTKISTNFGRMNVSRLVVTTVHRLPY
jgi:hypothetical protein